MPEQEVFEALKYRIEVDTLGTRWYRNAMGQQHRENGPAVEYADGSRSWYQNGLLHRTDGPAIVGSNGYTACGKMANCTAPMDLLSCMPTEANPGTSMTRQCLKPNSIKE